MFSENFKRKFRKSTKFDFFGGGRFSPVFFVRGKNSTGVVFSPGEEQHPGCSSPEFFSNTKFQYTTNLTPFSGEKQHRGCFSPGEEQHPGCFSPDFTEYIK